MYRNISYVQSKDKRSAFIDIWTWDESGNRIYKRIPHKSFVTYEVDYKTDLQSIYGTYLKRKFFETTSSRYQWIKDHPEKKIYESSTPEFEYLNSHYSDVYQEPDFAKNDLRVHYIDIEIAIEDEFPETDKVDYPINLITVYDSDYKKYFTWALGDCKVHRDDIELFTFDNEVKLLNHYLSWHERNYPDVITTWNGKLFDIPYMCGRIKRVLGENAMKSMSPVNRVKKHKDRVTGEPLFVIDGITNWDYYILYKNKFLKKSKGSYSLGNVGDYVLGISKIEYEGSMKDLYKKDFQKFFEYNIRDVEILVLLEEKEQLLKLSRSICNMSLAPYEKIYASIPYIINCLSLYTYNTTGKIFPKVTQSVKDSHRFEGAFVFPTVPGFFKNGVAVIDLNSLYPNTLIAGNMSPETKVGTYDKISDNQYSIHTTKGDTKHLNKEQFEALLKTKCINTDNNTLFLKHEVREGIVPTFCKKMYSDRKKFQKKMNDVIRQINKTKDETDPNPDIIKELENERDRYNFIQYTWKIFLNSIYGMFGTEFSPIYDIDIAQSITLNGQFVIKAIPEFVVEHMKEKYSAEGDIVLFGDTDSIGIDYESAVTKYCNENQKDINDLSRHDIRMITKDLDEFVNKDINEHCAKIVNERFNTTQGDNIAFSREKFCMEAMFFSKKHYILHIVDKDGHKTDEFDYKGVDIAKNELAPLVKTFLKSIFEKICRERWNQERFNQELEEVWNDYKTLPFEEIKRNTGWNTNKKSTGFLKVESKTGTHVKAAHYYNQMIEHLGVKGKYEELKVGDDVQWCYINQDNPFNIEVIGYKDIYPKEFNDVFQVDYNLKFEKDIVKPLQHLCDIMHWIPFNPNEQTAQNIFDL